MATVGSITFPESQPDNNITAATKITTSKVTESDKEKNVVTYWADFGGATAQVDTATVTAGTVGDVYQIAITSGGSTEFVEYVQNTGDTADDIAEALAVEFSGTDVSLAAAVASANVITLTGANPGDSITYDVTSSTTPANLAIASTTAASGTGNVVKVAEHKYFFAVAEGSRVLSVFSQNVYYNADGTVARSSVETRDNHSVAMETIKANATGG